MKLSDITHFNPSRKIVKGSIVPFVDMAALMPYTRDISSISQELYKGSGSRFCDGDVLFARITPCLENGKTAQVKNLGLGTYGFGSSEFIVLSAKEPVYDEKFIYYVACLPEFRIFAKKRMEGTSGRQRVSWQSIAEFELFDLPKESRRDIGEILASLDDKIELNRRTNETLEAIARALFKEWFVDFGPVRAKQRGEQPVGMSAELAALFPDRLDDDGKPEGWEWKPLDQIANFLNGLALQKFPGFEDDDLPVIKIANLRSGTTSREVLATKHIAKQYIIQDGDVIFSWSGSLMQCIWTGGVGALNQHLFKVTSELYPKWFYYLWVDYHLPEFQQIAASKATTMGHIQRHHLTEAKTLVASDKLMAEMDKIISPLIDKIISNSLESRRLAEMRDLLLPKLLSGEIRLVEAEQAVGQVL